MIEDHALKLAVLGNQYDAVANCLSGRFRRDIFSVQLDGSRLNGIRAGYGTDELRATGSNQSGDAEYFALSHRETHVPESAGGGGQARHFQDLAVLWSGQWREHLLHAPPDHRLNYGADGNVGRIEFLDFLAITHDDDTVGNLFDLLQPVGDVDDPDTFRFQSFDLLEQQLCFFTAQRSRRLVKYEKFRIQRQRLGNLDQLLTGRRKSFHRAAW